MGTELALIPENVKVITEKLDSVLSPGERRWVLEHIAEGAPGFKQYMQSDRLKRSLRRMFDDYLEFIDKGE